MSDTTILLHPKPVGDAAPIAAPEAPASESIGQPGGEPVAPTAVEAPPAPAASRRRATPERPAFGMPHVSSSEIRAELRRREARIAQLLAERAEIVAEMEQLEATLDGMRDD